MPLNLRPQHLLLAVASAGLGMVLTAGILLFSQRRTTVAFDCHDERDVELIVPELILQSGSEYLLAFPSIREQTNSHLVSLEAPAEPLLPARWRFQKAQLISADATGFRLHAAGDSGGDTMRFNTATAEWSSQPTGTAQNTATAKATSRRCRRLTALPASVSALNGVPLEYLQLRPWPLPILNPSLSQADLRLSLARVIAGRTGSDYSFYKLVAPLPRSALTPADEERLQAARRVLAAELSSTESFWEFAGTSTASWEYPNEQTEAERHAADWCSQQSEGNLQMRLAQGYQLVSSTPQGKDSGQLKALYPDGRFSGYVNYTASCQGSLVTVRKEADLSTLR